MAVLNLISFVDESGAIMVRRRPADDRDEIRMGSQLIVQENQLAYFFRDGKFLDSFGPGRHTLSTNNLPLLGGMTKTPFGNSPFKAFVYFISLKTFANLGWGTSSPVLFRDSDLRMVSLRAHGLYSIRIANPILFLNTLVGTKGFEFTTKLEGFFRTIIVSHLNGELGRKMKSILDLPVLYDEIAETTKYNVRTEFAQYGLELVDLIVEAIMPPEDVQKMLNRATGVAAQDVDKYRVVTSADAALEAAKNPGSGSATGVGAALGLGLGISMAQNLSQGMGIGSASTQPPKTSVANMEEIKSILVSLKELLDSGVISIEEYERQKQKLLGQI